MGTTEVLVCTNWHIYKYLHGTGAISVLDVGDLTGSEDLNRWAYCTIRDHTILCNGVRSNRKWDGTDLEEICPAKPDASLMTATPGVAGNPNGVYLYAVQYRNSTDGSISERSTDVVTANPANEKVDLAVIPQSDDDQADEIVILRTKAAGSLFYYLDTIADGVTTYLDDIADGSLVTLYDPRVGKPATALFCVSHNGRLYLAEAGTRRIWYSEVSDDILKPNGWSSFYYDNFLDLEDDPEEPTGAIAIGGDLLVTKRHSLWVIAGFAPQHSVWKLHEGLGCVNHATIAASDRGIYFMTPTGVALLPLPLGSGPPIDITDGSQRPLFEDMTDEDRYQAHGVYDPVHRQYMVSFVSSDEAVTLVFSEKNASWALLDFDAGEFAACSDGGYEPIVLMGWRGYLTELHDGFNDGADASSMEDVVGTLTSAWATGIEDTEASFSTDGSGLANVNLTVIHSNGDEETRPILCNTGTILHISEPWDDIPSADDTYYLGGYDSFWMSPRWAVDDRPGDDKIVRRIRIVFRDDDPDEPSEVLVGIIGDDRDGTEISPAVMTGVRLVERVTSIRGHEHRVFFFNRTPGAPFEIEGFELLWTEAGQR